MSGNTTTVGRRIADFLRQLVADGLLPKDGVALILEHAMEVGNLKEVVDVDDTACVLANFAAQRDRNLMSQSVYDRLAAVVEAKSAKAPVLVVDFYAIPRPAVERWVVCIAPFDGDPALNRISLEPGQRVLVLHTKEGSDWAVGEVFDNGHRGLFPLSYTVAVMGAHPAPRAYDAPPPLRTAHTASGAVERRQAAPQQHHDPAPPPLRSANTVSGAVERRQAPQQLPQPQKEAPPSLRTVQTAPVIERRQTLPKQAVASTINATVSPGQDSLARAAPEPDDSSTRSRSKSVESVAAAVITPAAAAAAAVPATTPAGVIDGPRYAFLSEGPVQLDAKKKTVIHLRRSNLLRAAYDGDEKLFRMLLKQGLPLDIRDVNCGDTALMCAAFNNQTAFAKMLIKEGFCCVSETNNIGESALHLAVANQNVELAKLLVQKGADAMLRDDNGRKPLQMAPDQTFERALREAEKKRKKIVEPVMPPAKLAAIEEDARRKREASEQRGAEARMSSLRQAKSHLITPSAVDPKEDVNNSGAVKWATLRGVTDAIDVVYVHLGNATAKALTFPIKRTSSAGDCVNYIVNKLMLTEHHRQLHLISVDQRGQIVEIPDFKPVMTVKNSYPNNRFVLAPKPGATRDVHDALALLTSDD